MSPPEKGSGPTLEDLAHACATIRDWVAAWPPSPRLRVARDLLVGAIREANRHVLRLGTGKRRPGTTVAAMLWGHGGFVVAHVGDNRVVTRAIGTHRDVEVDVQLLPVLPGDVFLLASDGLEVLGPHDVRACLELPPAAAVERLIARSLAEGAPDNVTVIATRVGDAERPFDGRLL